MEEDQELSEYESLLRQYLTVCNKVLKTNQDKVLLNQLWQTLEETLNEEHVVIALFDDRVQEKHALKFKDQTLQLQVDSAQEKETHWNLRYSELEHVIEHADDYIENPSQLDLRWLIRARNTA